MGIRLILLMILFLGLVQAVLASDADSADAEGRLAPPEVSDTVAGVYDFLIGVAEDQAPGSPLRIAVDEIGASQKGVPILLCTISHSMIGPDAGAGGLMVVARQHGDEPAGTWAMVELIRMIASEPDGNTIEAFSRTTVRIVPVANPDGMEAFQRRTANGGDMNRDWNSLRLPETRAIAAAIDKYRPDILLDLHEMTPRDGGQFHLVGVPPAKAAGLLWTVKEALRARGLPARTLAREGSKATSLLHRHFAANYGRAALLVESKYSSDPHLDMERRSYYHVTVVLAALRELSSRTQTPLSTASATRFN